MSAELLQIRSRVKQKAARRRQEPSAKKWFSQSEPGWRYFLFRTRRQFELRLFLIAIHTAEFFLLKDQLELSFFSGILLFYSISAIGQNLFFGAQEALRQRMRLLVQTRNMQSLQRLRGIALRQADAAMIAVVVFCAAWVIYSLKVSPYGFNFFHASVLSLGAQLIFQNYTVARVGLFRAKRRVFFSFPGFFLLKAAGILFLFLSSRWSGDYGPSLYFLLTAFLGWVFFERMGSRMVRALRIPTHFKRAGWKESFREVDASSALRVSAQRIEPWVAALMLSMGAPGGALFHLLRPWFGFPQALGRSFYTDWSSLPPEQAPRVRQEFLFFALAFSAAWTVLGGVALLIYSRQQPLGAVFAAICVLLFVRSLLGLLAERPGRQAQWTECQRA